MKNLKNIISRNEDFAKWYTSIIKNAHLISYSSVKGSIIFMPYSYAIWENMKKILNKYFADYEIENLYMPLLIPKNLLQKEKEMIDGFAPECLTVTKVGDRILENELIIRPTSEVLFGELFSNELQTYNDLPIKYNQWANVFRWEKTTRPFLRTTEFLWQEGHTIHETSEEASNFSFKIIKLYEYFFKKYLRIPVFIGKKTDKEKFSGAKETYTIESLMYDGQALQSGTSHYFSDRFSKTFKIKFLDKKNKMQHPYYTSWGVSTRMIGALIMTHSDDSGLVLPTEIAPIQFQIITINFSEEVMAYTNKIKNTLNNYRVKIDYTKKSFGYKRSETEIKGIPFRIEIGNKEVSDNTILLVRRDDFSKKIINLFDLKNNLKNIINDYNENLYNRALDNNKKKTIKLDSYEEYKRIIKTGNFMILVPFCCKIECENKIKEETQTNSRCIPNENFETSKKCFRCNFERTKLVYFARAY